MPAKSKKGTKKSSSKRAKVAPAKNENSDGMSCGSCGSCARCACGDGGGMFYFLGFLGAFIYYMSVATGFWSVVLGILKALIWPAMLVIKLLGM